MLWNRKSPPPLNGDRSRVVGLDLTSSRALGVSVAGGRSRALVFDAPAEELAMFVNLERRVPAVGRAGYAIARKFPHLLCSNFLASLGQPREWRGGRLALTPEAALQLAFEKVRPAIAAETDAVAVALPSYLAPPQAAKLVEVAGRAGLPIRRTVSAPLAVVADRAAQVLEGKADAAESDEPVALPDWVVPLRPTAPGPGAVVVLDVDEFALSGAVVSVERDRVQLLAAAAWPRAGAKAWKDRLLDAVSDRCVRLCRRDPRDSADAEQALFEQLDAALDRARNGRPVTLAVRTAHWYQDVVQQPDDFEAHCLGLTGMAAAGLQELVASAGLPVPPRAVWLTHAAGRLPGLFKAVHAHSAEATAVDALPAQAAAVAVARLVPLWGPNELPGAHLDGILRLPNVPKGDEGRREKGARVKW